MRRHKRIWKRLRFWLVMFLLIVVAFGLLVFHVHRKSLGPPPTLPRESPEFDKLLAEIDENWLFVFEDDGRLFLRDIHGNDKGLLF